MIKKIAIVAVSVAVMSMGSAFAANSIGGLEINLTTPNAKKDTKTTVSVKEFFTQYCNTVGYGVPEVFRQIPLRIPGIKREDALYPALQKCVYLGFIPNSTVNYQWESAVTSRFVNVFVSKTLKMDPEVNEDEKNLSRVNFLNLLDTLPNYKMLMGIGSATRWGTNSNYSSTIIKSDGFGTLAQIYELLRNEYRSGDMVTDKTLIEGAIKGISDAVGDIHTQYFPPTEAQDFNDQLNGVFEGIGSYLDMVSPGQVVVTSVLKDSPAFKAGLLANDIIVKVDDYMITEKDSLNSVIAKIKGPAGTTVKLVVQRGNGTQSIIIKREKININLIEYTYKSNTPIISIHTFGRGISATWQEMLNKNKAAIQNAGKLVIDLRNNPGGSLQEVADMLSDFVDKDQPVVITTSRYQEEQIVSSGRKTIDFSKIKIVILINASTASASEIMAGTIKDYLPKNTVIIGETSYGKGSVQYLQQLADNASFKLTIAHRYTGKNRRAIEAVGIQPDIEVRADLDQLKQGYDTQLEAALRQ